MNRSSLPSRVTTPGIPTGLHLLLCLLTLCTPPATAQSPATREALTVTKIDPPNWYSTLPEPLLLLRGTGFTRAEFTLSDPALRITQTKVSDNGHWAQLTLGASPLRPETVQLRIRSGSRTLNVPYRFAEPRRAGQGAAGFSPRDVLYLILTDRFADGDLANDGPHAQSQATSPEALAERARPRGWHGGDIAGVLRHLDYLQQLGITAVWLTPVYVNDEPQAYHGYHATDYYGVDPHLGTLAELQQLAQTLHSRGMKLVLDTVPNHVGPGHPWVADEPTPQWFHGTAAHHLPAQTNFRALIDPHAPERDRIGTLQGWFADALPDMNTDDPAVAQYGRQNAVWWIEQTGADALRIDTFAFVNRSFWNAFNGELKDLFPHLTEVGEVFDPHPEITSAFADGVTRAGTDTRLYTPFDFPTYFAARDVFGAGKPMSELAEVLAADALYPHPERLVPFLGNHDTSRFAEVVADPALRQLAFDFLMTTRGTPQIYSGDEIGMTGGGDPNNRRDFPGGFPAAASSPASPEAQGENAFAPAGRTSAQQAAYSGIQQLAALRRAHPTLACGAEQVLASGPDLLVYARYGSSGCGEPATGSLPEHLLVVLQRGIATPIHLDLGNTALAGLAPGTPLAGAASITRQGDQFTLSPSTSFLVVPFP